MPNLNLSKTDQYLIYLPIPEGWKAELKCDDVYRTTIDIPGTEYRLSADPSAVCRTAHRSALPPIVLPDASTGNIDWNSLVSVANRTLEGN